MLGIYGDIKEAVQIPVKEIPSVPLLVINVND